jgi:hypothetical protein
MDEEMGDVGDGPQPDPSLEEELVNQFGSEILHNSPHTPPGEDDTHEEDNEYGDDELQGSSDECYGAMDLSGPSRHHVSDSDGEVETNPLRAILKQRQVFHKS